MNLYLVAGTWDARLHARISVIHQVLVCLHGLASFLYAIAATCWHRTTSLLPAAAHSRLLHYVPPVMYLHGEWDASILCGYGRHSILKASNR
jgi:hypothetical protein